MADDDGGESTACADDEVLTCSGSLCTMASFVGDGECDSFLDCASTGFDGGDCEAGETAACAADEVLSCTGYSCWPTSSLGDGTCDEFLDCYATSYDDGDCAEIETDPDSIDDDGDGYSELEGDCDDSSALISPEATDIVGDDLDLNCDGVDGVDADGDGYASVASGGTDCDDSDDAVRVDGALEVCPVRSCKQLLAEAPDTEDGVYWVGPEDMEPWQAYCDMSSDGGGWMLIAQGGMDYCGGMSGSVHMRDTDECSYLSDEVVRILAEDAEEVRLHVGMDSHTFGAWTTTARSTSSAAVEALRTGDNWRSASFDNWTWGGEPLDGWDDGWPNMYQAGGVGDGVHWLASYSHSLYGGSGGGQISATWIR